MRMLSVVWTVFAAILLPYSYAEVPDVTTVYDVKNMCEFYETSTNSFVEDSTTDDHFPDGYDLPPRYQPVGDINEECNSSISGRVFKRTNSLGLDLFLNNEKSTLQSNEPGWACEVRPSNDPDYTGWTEGYTTESEIGESAQETTVPLDLGSSCAWEYNGWTDSYSDSSPGTPVKDGDTFSLLDGLTLDFSRDHLNSDTNHEIRLVLTSYSGNYRNFYYSYYTTTHLMNMFDRNDKYSRYWYICNPGSTWGVTNRDGGRAYLSCDHQYGNYLIHYNSTLKFESSGEDLKIYANGSTSPLINMYSSNTLQFLTLHYVQNPSVMRVRRIEPVPVKMSDEDDSSIVSPSFIPSTKNICLTLVLYCSTDIKSNVLSITAVDADQTELYQLYHINNLEQGWQVRQIRFTIPNNIVSPLKLEIKKVSAVEIQIRRIASCSNYDLEMTKLSDTVADQNNIRHSLPVYTATSDVLPSIEKTADVFNSCLNGGVMTTAGCACPPGFTGINCQTGCGRGKIGQDCRGRCSYRSRGCEGFLVCSAFTGCKCAPGYGGYNCKSECSEGWYGNDCEQRCGHCAEGGTCNKYTGECESCRFGYVSPNCRQEYVYYSFEPTLVSDQYKTITVSFDLQDGVKGFGEAKLYQIQYKEKGDSEWQTHTINPIPEADSSRSSKYIKETIDGLKAGTWYLVRVLLMDTSFNKYDGELVKPAQVLTHCDVPGGFDYDVHSTSNATAFMFTWNYDPSNEYWCPVDFYEVSWRENGEWMSDVTSGTSYTLNDFDPGLTIEFKVRAKTSSGFAPYSASVVTSTEEYEIGSVKNLRMDSAQSTGATISWLPPPGSEGRQLKYNITFKCVSQVICAPGCQDAEDGQVTQEETNVTLRNLLPFTQYLVTVTPENGTKYKLYVGTKDAVPTEAPIPSTRQLVRSDSSVTVFWEPVSICSSFQKGYTYQLHKASDSMKLLARGFTKDTSMSFYNLTASTDYVVKVFINTVAGWNPDVFLSINISTSATVPEAVQNLTVYKKGRNMLGLRWLEPEYLYGELKSFTVQYSLGKDVRRETIEPTHCVVWPEYYCHTLKTLKPNRKYEIMVSARNKDVQEDGAVASLSSMTKESAPLPPEDLKVLNSTSTSVSLQWKHPSLINGVLRSFLINIEETERFDQDSCCQDYPMVEVQVKKEEEFYQVEVSGLQPASTYLMSVSAKTVSMGPSQSLVVSTRPPHMSVSVLPTWTSLADRADFASLEEVQWSPQENLAEVNTSDVFSPLIRGHILVATTNNTEMYSIQGSKILDEQLSTLLLDSIDGSFRFIAEYNEEGLDTDSQWGERSEDIFFPGETFQLVAVQITEYSLVYNVDLCYSSTFVYN